MNHWLTRTLLVSSLALCGGAAAQPPAAPEQAVDGAGTLQEDLNRLRHMTVPVTLGAAGIFRFGIDTAAERTIVSRELAATLGFRAAGEVRVASMADVSNVPSVTVPSIAMGAHAIRGIQAPALHEFHMGAQGILGVDSLQDQRVTFDFETLSAVITPARAAQESWPDGTIVVEGRTRLGRLILADATVGGQRVWAIVDTGSPISIGNAALRDRVMRTPVGRRARTIEVTDVTGAKINVQYTLSNRLRLSDAQVDNLPMAFADLPVFRELGLEDRPTILLGMDVLQLFRRVEVDFATRRVRLLPTTGSFTDRPAQLAGLRTTAPLR